MYFCNNWCDNWSWICFSVKKFIPFSLCIGKFGILGIIISAGLIGYIVYKTLKIIKKNDINNYDEFLDSIIGNFKTKNINIKIVLNFIINVFLLITFFIMCAGFSAYFKQELGVNIVVTSIFVSILCFFILNKSIKGIFILNSVLMPVIIVLILFLGIKVFNINTAISEVQNSGNWFLSSVLYASYNSITLISILIPMKKYIESKKDISKIAVSCALTIIGLAITMFILLGSIDLDISKIELPTIYATKKLGEIYKYLYGGVILSAILTTAISSGYRIFKQCS